MTPLLVMKFGGTSMGSAERIRVAAALAAEQQGERPTVVVVSAMSKVTDMLLEALRGAETGDGAGVGSHLRTLLDRHLQCARQLLPPDRQPEVLENVHGLVTEFSRLAHGMELLGERPPRSVDEALAVGEKLSAALMVAYLNSSGVAAEAVSGGEVIVTDAVFGNAAPHMSMTREKAAARLHPLLEAKVLPVVTGFNGATADGRATTLGRGGSDFSAAILAGALDAGELWIWTDVDGIMSADPRLVPDAAVLEAVTYNEAAELAYNGAKVLHPRTLAPLAEKQIPVWSKNSFAPHKPGTRIVPYLPTHAGPRAVTSMSEVALVSIEPASAAVNGTRMMARVLDALAQAGAEVLAVSSSSYRQSFCFLVRRAELSSTLACLEGELHLELGHGYLRPIGVDDNVGLLAVVGEGMRGTAGLAGRVFTAISRENVNIIAIAQGSSELTISVVVRREGLEKAVKAIHAECGMGVQPEPVQA